MSGVLKALALAGAWELAWWARRRYERGRVFALARAEASKLGLPLVVVGSPDGGVTAGYGCGDVTVDLAPSSTCPSFVQADITKSIPLPTNSCVVFVSCVLEYVDDLQAAWNELCRVSGGRVYVVRVEPWTLTAYLYPGAKRTLPSGLSCPSPSPALAGVAPVRLLTR